jgi:hypothetical protein
VTNDSLLDASVGELGAGALITTNAGPLNGGRVVELLGTVAFTTPPVRLPEPGNSSGVTLTAPFTITGTVQGYNPFARDPTLLFTADLSGVGIARMSVPFNPHSGTFDPLGTLSYQFQTTAPTPEPASLLLFGAGIVAVATKRFRRGMDRISSI